MESLKRCPSTVQLISKVPTEKQEPKRIRKYNYGTISTNESSAAPNRLTIATFVMIFLLVGVIVSGITLVTLIDKRRISNSTLAPNCPYNNTLLPPLHGNVNCGLEEKHHICRFQCDVGYKLHGLMTLECKQNGNWDADEPICVAVSCPSPPAIKYGEVTCNELPAHFNDTCNYKCQRERILKGSSSITCYENGAWHGKPPVCVCPQCKVGVNCSFDNKFEDVLMQLPKFKIAAKFHIVYAEYGLSCNIKGYAKNFQLKYKCHCKDDITGVSSKCSDYDSQEGAAIHTVSQTIRSGINQSVYPQPCDPTFFAKYRGCE